MGPSIGPVNELRRFISSSWYEVVGRVSEGHLRAGTRVEAAKKWKQATSYVERYMAKPEEFPEGLRTGRIWGVWNEELLPVRWETVEVSLRDAFRIRTDIQEAGKEEGYRFPTLYYGVREARERAQAAGVLRILLGVAESFLATSPKDPAIFSRPEARYFTVPQTPLERCCSRCRGDLNARGVDGLGDAQETARTHTCVRLPDLL